MGIVDVAAFAAGPAPPAKITSTDRRASSAASAGSRLRSSLPHRYSIATFWLST
jgi:hypothetical protein